MGYSRQTPPVVPAGAASPWRSGSYAGASLGALADLAFSNGNGPRGGVLYLPGPVAFDRIGVQVKTAGAAGALVRLGVVRLSDLAVVLDAGTIDASSIGFKELTIALTLPSGAYVPVALCQGTGGCSLRGAIGGPNTWGPRDYDSGGTDWGGIATGDVVAGALTNPQPSASRTNTVPQVLLRAA
jgi:hypothetical protein